MSAVKVLGHASGSGTITLSGPNASSDRTLTLPDATCTLLNADGDGSSLTGSMGASTLSDLSTTLTVSASAPTVSSNPSATGHMWIDKTAGRMYICTTSTAGSNVWTNVGAGTGQIS